MQCEHKIACKHNNSLRHNFNLDESKSSLLEAQTVEEFILEKYPSFKFENGTVLAGSEEDVYLGASLLLYFVCVNSKDVDLKSAMCSKLSGEDQETILKFSKSLMECSPVTCRDVYAAISEACGQEMATIDMEPKRTVAETPPALRSLHGEVRRLQAALEAERFDRNYLQEELSRTNLRVEKLVKDKEKYKLDILNLTAKISMCGGGEREACGAEPGVDEAPKLLRQLNDMEERLVRTQEMLDEAAYDRDEFKKKLEDLKEDRDKWVAMSQQESGRACQLAEELDKERRHLQSLKELIAELRQHNRLNGLDTSQLECDDPDASNISFPHNTSVCSEACVNVIEVQLCEERAKVDSLKEQIQTLQEEHAQLRIAFEESNSIHEVIIQEKNTMIDKLGKQLENQILQFEMLRKDHEDITLSMDKYMLETRRQIEEKDEQMRQLEEWLTTLRQEYNELESFKNELNNKIDELIQEINDSETKHNTEIQKLQKLLSQEKATSACYAQDKEILHRELIEERSAKDRLEAEQNHLHENYKLVVSEKKELLNAKMILAQQLSEEKSLRNILEEQKNALATQNATIEKSSSKQVKNIKKKLSKEVLKSKALLQEKDNTKQYLEDAKAAIQLAKNEKNALLVEKNLLEENIIALNNIREELSNQIVELTEKVGNLEQQFENEKANNEVLNEEKNMLIKNLTEEKSSKNALIGENECLTAENESLKNDLLVQKTVQEVLLNEKEVLLLEKEDLGKALEVEKCAHDQLETEKHSLFLKLNELNEKFVVEVNMKLDDIDKVAEQVEQLQLKCEDLEELNNQISKTVNEGLDRLIQVLKSEETRSEILQKEISAEIDLMSTVDRCNLLFTIANKLVSEAIAMEGLQKALEHRYTAEAELKDVLKCKEEQICELMNETKCLQQAIEDVRVEFNKQEKLYTREMDNKVKEIKALNKENETLTNDLNSVKIQLDIKVHSLKEKLLENENLTDKLKKSYECQINNLNLMATKLTNYLKDKTNELELMRKEKDKLQLIIDENNTAMKALEEEVKTEKQSQEKLITDFESERQILKNMVTVTESVMEDQKVTLNNVIAENVKSTEMLLKDNRNIKEQIENERKDFERKLTEKEKTLEQVQSDLAELRESKEQIVKELKSQIEALDLEIHSLKTEVQNREEEIRKMKNENSNLESLIQNYKQDVITREKENSELKINMDAVEVEFRNKADKLAESLNKQMEHKLLITYELAQKTEYITDIENKLKQLEDKIYNLEQEKVNLLYEKDCMIVEHAATINEIQNKFETTCKKYADDINILSKSNAVLMEENTKLLKKYLELEEEFIESKNVNENVSVKLDKLKKGKIELGEKFDTLKRDNISLEEEFNKFKKINSQVLEEYDKLKQDSVEMKKELAKLKRIENDLEAALIESKKSNTDSQKELDKLKTYNIELTEELCKLKNNTIDLENESAKLKKKNAAQESKLGELKNQNMVLTEETNKLNKYISQLEEELHTLKQHNIDVIDILSTLKNENNSLQQELALFIKYKKDLEDQLNTLKDENTDLTEQVKFDIIHLEEELNKFKQYNTDIVQEMESLKKDNNKLKQEFNKVQNDNTDLEGELNKVNSSNKTLEEQIMTLSYDKDSLEQELKKMSKYKNELEDHLTTTKTNNSELAENLNKFKKYSTDASEELAKQKKYSMQLEVEFDKLKSNNTNMEKELIELERKYHQMKNDGADLNLELLKFKEDNSLLSEELDKVKKNKNELETELAKIKHDNITVAEQHRAKCSQLTVESCMQKLSNAIELNEFKNNKLKLEAELEKLRMDVKNLTEEIDNVCKHKKELTEEISALKKDKTAVIEECDKLKNHTMKLEEELSRLRTNNMGLDKELNKLKNDNIAVVDEVNKLKKDKSDVEMEVDKLKTGMTKLTEEIGVLQKANKDLVAEISTLKMHKIDLAQTIIKLEKENVDLTNAILKKNTEIAELKQAKELYNKIREEINAEKITLVNKCDILQEYHSKAEKELEERQKEISSLQKEIQTLQGKVELSREDSRAKDGLISKMSKEKDAMISTVNKTLQEEKVLKEKYLKEVEEKTTTICELKMKLMILNNEREALNILKNENAELIKAVGYRETMPIQSQDIASSQKYSGQLAEREVRDLHHQKQLYTEQITVFKEKQKEEIAMLERELALARDKLAQTSRAYEQHIRGLTSELWDVGEKFLVQKDEADWLRRKQRSGSLMSLQHVHSSGLVQSADQSSRPSGAYSLRSLPINNQDKKRGACGMHMSDEEGEVFDNRCLKELSTPRRESHAPDGTLRLSELRWRNSLCPPHLKSSYPAETQFAKALNEEEIKAMGAIPVGTRQQRKEVGITAYKKPGPPTPSKQAGRLSATDSELRESLRVEADPHPTRKTSTPSRIRSLFRSSKSDMEGTPRTRRLSNIFKKK